MTLIPGKLNLSQFAALSRPEQLERWHQLSARQKVNLLLDLADGKELLAELPPQDLYLICREFGPDEFPELLAMASPEQWTMLFDFDCWDEDRFDENRARTWLAVLLEGEEEEIVATMQRVDFELLVLMVKREINVLSGPEEIDEADVRADAMGRDGGYQLEFRDEAGAKLYGRLLDVLFRHDNDFFRFLLESVRAEGDCLLEESVYQQRATRLLDQGIPDRLAALEVYAWLDPERLATEGVKRAPLGGVGGAAPGQLLQLARSTGLAGRILANGVSGETAWELACLLNKVLMADRVELGDLEEVRGAAERTLGILDLALECQAGEDLAKATELLRETYVEPLFRFGYSLTLRLQRRAQAVQKSVVGPYLDTPYRTLLDALLQRRPQFPESLVRPERGGRKPFTTLREVRLVEEWLARLEAQQHLFAEQFPFPLPPPAEWNLDGCHPSEGGELTLSTLFLTALANQLLGRAFAPGPLPAGELSELHGMVSRDGRLDTRLKQQTLAWLETLTANGSAFGDYALARWEEDFCAIAANELDPRYLGGLIVRLDN
jgi:hypothetical protein